MWWLACASPGITVPIEPPKVPVATPADLDAFRGWDAGVADCTAGTPTMLVASSAGVGLAGGDLAPWGDGVPSFVRMYLDSRANGWTSASACHPDGAAPLLIAADADLDAERLFSLGTAAGNAGYTGFSLLVDADGAVAVPAAPATAPPPAVVVGKDRFEVLDGGTTPVTDLRAWVAGRPERRVILTPEPGVTVGRVAAAWSAIRQGGGDIWLGSPADAPVPPAGASPARPRRALGPQMSVLTLHFPDASATSVLQPAGELAVSPDFGALRDLPGTLPGFEGSAPGGATRDWGPPPESPPPSVKTTVTAGTDGQPAALAYGVRKRSPQLKSCYELLLRRTPGASGRVEVRLRVADGRAHDVAVLSNGTGDADFASCVERRVATWTFDPGVTGDLVVPFDFRQP